MEDLRIHRQFLTEIRKLANVRFPGDDEHFFLDPTGVVENLKHENSLLDSKFREAKFENEQLSRSMQKLSLDFGELKTENQILKSESNQFQVLLRDLQNRNSELQRDLKSQTDNYAKLMQDSRGDFETKLCRDNKMVQLESACAHQRTKLFELENELKNVSSDLKSRTLEIEELRSANLRQKLAHEEDRLSLAVEYQR